MKEPMCKKGTANISINSEPPKPTTFEDLGYVQVVRCKDCKHWNQYENYCFGECDIYKGYNRSGNWFCADGEKRE